MALWFIHVILIVLGTLPSSDSICTVSCPLCPCFASASQTISVREDLAIGSTTFTFIATDPLSLTLEYSIRAPPTLPNNFLLDSTTGDLRVVQELNYETTSRYEFTVMVENSNSQRDTISVVVDLINVDDNPTVCSESVAFFSVVEEQPIGELQLPICTDNDVAASSSSFDYSIITGNEMGIFLINGGNISLLHTLDYEIQTLYELSVSVVQSGGSLAFNLTIIIAVVPVNEHTPQFASATLDFTVEESASIGSSVGIIPATDDDAGSDGAITYSILSQTSDKFVVHPYSGEVIVARFLDYETIQQSFSLTVIARDSPAGDINQRSSTTQIRISVLDVNDNRPYFMSYVRYAGVSEQSNNVGREVTQMQCNDIDSGINQEVTYSIAAGNQEGKFSINSTSGQIVLVSPLNYEGNNTQLYNLTVECQEVQPPRGKDQSSLLIGVESYNEFYPDPGANYMATVSEDTPPGTSILRVQGRDRDRGPAGTLTYYINKDNTQYCPNSLFYIDRFTGIIYLNSRLDYESGLRTIYCTVIVLDSEIPFRPAEADLIVRVTNANDASPVCNPPVINATLSEDSTTGSQVVALSCTDIDSPTVWYSILERGHVPFQISSDGVLLLNGSLDYETSTSYSIPIEISDGDFSFNISVFVTVTGVNEYSPTFVLEEYVCTMDENEAIGSHVCTVLAIDDDNGQDGTLNYRIVSIDLSDTFFVGEQSGQIFLTGPIDYEQKSNFSFLVEAYDFGEPSLSSFTSVTVNVIDLNDNPPRMESFVVFTVSEGAILNERVGTLECVDDDSGVNAQLTMQVNSIFKVDRNGTEAVVADTTFLLDSATGDLTVNADLDYEINRLYRLAIVCRDNGTPSLATFSMVTLIIAAENEFTPSFSQLVYSVDVSENTTIGSSILVVSATDSDSGAQGDILFFIQNQISLPFSINYQSGLITLSGELDCLQSLNYTLTVVARDRGTPSLQSEVNVFVNVINCRLGDLIPERNVYTGSVEENSPVGTIILTVVCNSSRTSLGLSYVPKYRILSEDMPANYFQVDENSGQVTISTPPDYETTKSHQLWLQCFDENYPEVTVNITTYISVNPVNEHAPQFNENSYTFSVDEGTPLGTIAFTLAASDLDSGRDGELTYSIGGVDSHYVIVDAHTGDVFLTTTLDRESRDELTLTASVHDNPEDINLRRSSSATVRVRVIDSNDHWPQCNRTVYHLIVSPQAEPGSTILSNLGCSDLDLGANSELEYTLSDPQSEEIFAVDRQKGNLTLVGSLDPEDSVSHQVSIIVHDLGIPSLSTIVLVVIDVHEPPLSVVVSDSGDGDLETLLEAEGLRNAITIILSDISFTLWNTTTAPVRFQEVVADSVTKYCALLPEACSLITGCSKFYGIRKRRSVDNYANFLQPNVVIISNNTIEMTSTTGDGTDISVLQVTFYVLLPSDAERAPYRETNFVVPRSTLSEIVRQDEAVIQAVVRNSLSPLLTHHVQQLTDAWQVVGISFLLLFSVVVIALLIVTLIKRVFVIKEKKSNRVIPIKKKQSKQVNNETRTERHAKRSQATELFTNTSNKTKVNIEMTDRAIPTSKTKSTSLNASSSTVLGNNKLSKCSLTGLTWHRAGAKESSCTSTSSPLQWGSSSSVSHLSLDNDQASMENNASNKSRRSMTSDLDRSSPSALGDSQASRERPGSDDYLDNFPYAPRSRIQIPVHGASLWTLRHK